MVGPSDRAIARDVIEAIVDLSVKPEVRGSAGHAVPAAGSVMHSRIMVTVQSHGLRTGGHVLTEVSRTWGRLSGTR